MATSTGLILVTGAGGNVGREVVRALASRGAAVRAATREPAADFSGGVTTVPFDFGDPSSYAAAFEGATALFLLRPPAIANVQRFIRPAIDRAAAAGMRHIVFLSLLGADRNSLVPHARIERLVEASGVPYTFLRCGFFMQNLNTTHRADIADHDDLFIPAGKGRTAFIDTRDIGEIAARVLTEPGHDGRAYALTGSEALSYDEVARIMSEVLGRQITYSNPSPLAFARRMRARGHTWSYIAVMWGVYLTTRQGKAAVIAPDAAELLGRPPRTLKEYVSDFADAWQKDAF